MSKDSELNRLKSEEYFLMFRLHGAKPELWERKWKLGDPELVE